MKDIRQTPQYARYLSKLGWETSRVEGVNVFAKRIFLLGFVVKIQRPSKLNTRILTSVEKKYKPFQIIIEPDNYKQTGVLIDNNFRLSKNGYLPSKTLHLNLTVSLDKILSQMKKDARTSIHKSAQISVQTISDLPAFHAFWKKAVPFTRWVPSLMQLRVLRSSFPSSTLFVASHNGEAGAVFVRAGSLVYYWQAFTSKLGRKTLLQYQIVFSGIKWAKKIKARVFDFEGLYDERFPLPSWKGFSHFKKSFGGREVEYPGCFVKTSWRNIIGL